MSNSPSVSASDYKEIDRLGAGSQGITNLLEDAQGNLVCGKYIFNADIKTAPEAEMLLKQLDCPYLVSFYHCIPTRRDLLLIMEYCAGGSLHDYVVVSKQKLSNTDIWVVTTQLLLGLAYLHSKAIVHRDLKPGNVLLCSHERPLKVKICDFGISRDLNAKSAKSMTGTVEFMAPEVLTGQRYDTSIDLWSLGILIYFLVHGEYPFISFTEIMNSNIPISNSEFGPIISKLLVRDPASRATAADLLLDPKIVEIYEDFIKETRIEDVVNLRRELRRLKKIIEDQSNLIGDLKSTVNEQNSKISSQNSEISTLKSAQEQSKSAFESKISSQNSEIERLKSAQEQSKNAFESKISSQNSLIQKSINQNSALESQLKEVTTKFSVLESENLDQKSKISSQNSEISCLKSTVDHQNSKIQQLESKLSQTSLLSSDQSNLIDQFKELLPFISHIKANAEEKRRIEEQRLLEIKRKEEENARKLAEEERRIEQEQKQNEFKTNPIQFICKYPSEIFSRFGNRTKFIRETKGSCLELSNDDCLVRSTQDCNDNSFVAINHPLNGRITLTLRSTDSYGWFNSCIGYFNPNKCQDDDCYNHFIGIRSDDGLHHGRTYFYTNGSYEKVTSKLSPSKSIIISFENNKVTYSTLHSGWSRTVDCVDGWVFGIVVCYQDESWSIQ
ncbi:hypothetical protein RCL1_007247 [Eukaryota sp. TZLM3-RCL]